MYCHSGLSGIFLKKKDSGRVSLAGMTEVFMSVCIFETGFNKILLLFDRYPKNLHA
jgi:hypothetical protein